MASRALYVVIDQLGKREVFLTYSHPWGGLLIPQDLFWGYDFVRPRIEALPALEGAMKADWVEGAAVLDVPRKVLVLWGGDEILADTALRDVYLTWAGFSWEGWQVCWARLGYYDIVRYLHWSVAQLTGADENGHFDNGRPLPARFYRGFSSAELHSREKGVSLLTVRWGPNQQEEYLLDHKIAEVLSAGRYLLVPLRNARPYRGRPARGTYPGGCAFIDVPRQSISFWGGDSFLESRDRSHHIQHYWSGWTVEEHHNGLYRHASLTGQLWQDYLPTEESILHRLYDLLLMPGALDFEDSRTGPVLGRSDRIERIQQVRQLWNANSQAYEDSLATPKFLSFNTDCRDDGRRF